MSVLKPSMLPWTVFGIITVLSIMYTNPVVFGQSQDISTTRTSDRSITYAQTASKLLNQTQMEYTRGNSTGAEELAIRAYLDNFEYVEAPLDQKGQHILKENIENMMRNDLRTMIKDKAPAPQVSELIKKIDSNLVEAITILNGTK
jgi:hypothetical protein